MLVECYISSYTHAHVRVTEIHAKADVVGACLVRRLLTHIAVSLNRENAQPYNSMK